MKTASDKLLHGSRVLVVEDNPLIAFDIIKTLHDAGAETLGPALSVARLLELAATETFDCAVLDVMLRDGSVFRAARILHQQGVGLVFYTGYFGLDRLKRAWPGSEVLFKPAPPRLLLQSVSAACCRSWH